MASPPTTTTGGWKWKSKYYIVAGLTAILAAAVVVTAFFVLLSPARIYFSVTNASSDEEKDGSVVLSFTLATNNTSQRAAVKYQSLFVDLSNNTGIDVISWIRTDVNTTGMSEEWYYPHGGISGQQQPTVAATLPLLAGPWIEDFFAGGEVGDAPLSVQVTAVVRFKVAGMRTRLYDITVRCQPVFFVLRRRRQSRRGHGTSSSSPSSAAPPVGCWPVGH